MDQAAARTHGRMGGLDGLRGLAVALVVVFHAWPSALPGGFLGVTLFFSLSGYLITSILADELDRTGGIELRRFWGRRCRRLLPASLATLLAIAVIWGAAGWLTGDVRHDLTAGVLQVANWSQIAANHPYGAAGDTSPVLHFWSLAIEEQFYWVFPVVAIACGTVRRFGAVLVVLLAASVAASVASAGDAVVVYYATATRAAEMLAGAVVAIVLRRRLAAGWATRAAGVLGLAGVALLVTLSRITSLDTAAYYAGGLAVVGGVAAITIGAIVRSPWLGAALDVAPLSWLGSHSYAIYLFHWPLLIGLERVGLPAWPAIAVASTLVLAAASARWLEGPFRSPVPIRERIHIGRTSLVAVPVVSLLVVGAVLAPVDAGPPTAIDFDRAATLAESELRAVTYQRPVDPTPTVAPSPVSPPPPSTSSPAAAGDTGAAPPTGAAPTTDPAATADAAPPTDQAATTDQAAGDTGPVTFGFIGDSKALTLGIGATAVTDDRLVQLPLFAKLGCPIGRGGRSRVAVRDGRGSDTGDGCDWSIALPPSLAATGPVDVAIVYSGTWDARERQVPALGDGWTTLDDDAYRNWLYDEMVSLTQLLVDHGVGSVAWMTVVSDPHEEHPERTLAFNALVRTLAEEHPDTVTVIDLATWIAAQPDADVLLPDGAHTTFEPNGGTSAVLMQRLLSERILLAAES